MTSNEHSPAAKNSGAPKVSEKSSTSVSSVHAESQSYLDLVAPSFISVSFNNLCANLLRFGPQEILARRLNCRALR